ncbi:hypothetical protein CDD82_2459 [Ophiocordyceps australis]|uniref:Small ribosomal subunit protein mS38 n=1 Tax=Ophiocordyceps australis TaxID=1399860 RepID=A0A2C5Y5X2_9HYPO|nr:hypothetical protein CDD82_2459 [Ophiocordyceps australis]
MLPSSLHRVAVAAAPQAGFAPLSVPRPAVALVALGHQRRFSSSKPSRSDKNDLSAGQSVPASSSSTRGSEKRKRKPKDASDKASLFNKLPSVPSTSHMSQEALGLSSFFSLHRPISVTQTMPRKVSDEHFASIFTPRSKASKMMDTVSTISNSINQLDGPMSQMTISDHPDDPQMADSMQKVSLRNSDGSESSIYLQVDAMSGHFLPFCPPPLPDAQAHSSEGDAAAETTTEASDAMEERPMVRSYKAMFSIEETLEPDGRMRILAHSPVIVSEQHPRSFLSRMALRRIRFDEARGRGRPSMYALSTKRQRKLKIKKKKYKKLLKRTRNLRRKLDKN